MILKKMSRTIDAEIFKKGVEELRSYRYWDTSMAGSSAMGYAYTLLNEQQQSSLRVQMLTIPDEVQADPYDDEETASAESETTEYLETSEEEGSETEGSDTSSNDSN